MFALAGTLGLLASFLVVLYDVVDAVGDPLLFYPVVLLPLFAATVLARFVRVVVAVAIGALLLAGGLGWHVLTLSADLNPLLIVDNNLELLTGRTVYAIKQADVWALAVLPTPVFLTWFLALRRRYAEAVAVGGGMLGFLVLTGDASTLVTLLGVVSAGAMLAFGDIDTGEWSIAADRAAMVLAVMVAAPLLITIVPGGAASPVTFLDDERSTMEEAVVTTDSSLDVVGAIEQSSAARFTITSDQSHLWRTNSFDRYTGEGWVRSGDTQPYDGPLEEPPGPTERLTQTIEPESPISQIPAAWRAVEVGSLLADSTSVTTEGGLQLDGTLKVGQRYEVTSAVPNPSVENLTDSDADYPTDVLETYTQLPSSTPDRIGERTEHITQNADNAYETALVIEDWLETNRGYSLDVERPDGNIADAFLFEMDEGYCTYFATTMVTMLRSQDIPARLAVGYATGERVGENRYLVRGLDSHAWVEVYFPEVGWVSFDPTPADPREQAQQAALDGSGGGGGGGSGGSGSAAGGAGGDAVDDEGTTRPDQELGRDESRAPARPGQDRAAGDVDTTDVQVDGGDGGLTIPNPSREQLLLGGVAILGLVAGVRQSGVARRVSRGMAIRYQRRKDPATDVERAYDRLLLILEDRHRPRQTGETMRQYLADIDASDEVTRVVELREQSRYADEVTTDAADEAVELVDRIRKAENP
jgi:transglutaminase-like putative cysteine protease/type IV secretory pathway VirB2 component (pilin)